MNGQRYIPVLKASPKRLFDILDCVYNHPYDRDNFRECVLRLYPGRDEKSVFRGMVIPTLRRLGLIVGYEGTIRSSANGGLLVAATNRLHDEGLRVLRVLLLEIDQDGPHLLDYLNEIKSATQKDIEVKVLPTLVNVSNKQGLERVRDWIKYLLFSSLIEVCEYKLRLNGDTIQTSKVDADERGKEEVFSSILFQSYKELVSTQRGMVSVDITELRHTVALTYYNEHLSIVTEKQFDRMLARMPKTTSEYTIFFGRSMGTAEKLFVLDGAYYQTLGIRFSGR